MVMFSPEMFQLWQNIFKCFTKLLTRAFLLRIIINKVLRRTYHRLVVIKLEAKTRQRFSAELFSPLLHYGFISFELFELGSFKYYLICHSLTFSLCLLVGDQQQNVEKL